MRQCNNNKPILRTWGMRMAVCFGRIFAAIVRCNKIKIFIFAPPSHVLRTNMCRNAWRNCQWHLLQLLSNKILTDFLPSKTQYLITTGNFPTMKLWEIVDWFGKKNTFRFRKRGDSDKGTHSPVCFLFLFTQPKRKARRQNYVSGLLD